MIEPILLGLVILALAGWSATVILFARSTLPLANAFKVLHTVDDLFDKRINAVLDGARASKAKPVVPDGKVKEFKGDEDPRAAWKGEVQQMFGPQPLIAPDFGEQPDSDLEVVQA